MWIFCRRNITHVMVPLLCKCSQTQQHCRQRDGNQCIIRRRDIVQRAQGKRSSDHVIKWHKRRLQQTAKYPLFKTSALWADAFYKSKCSSVCVSVCLSLCLFTFEVPFKRLFSPTSQSRMPNILKDSESLGKSNGRKRSRIWTFLFGSGLKSPNKKK